MRIFFGTLMFLASATTIGSEMAPVPKNSGYCKTSNETYCYEWALTRDHAVRFIARGDEDVIEYSFYRVASGQYERAGDVYPVLKDEGRPGQLFWAYPWDITDIALGPDESALMLLGTFEHTFTVSDEYGNTISNERRPAVLFVGKTTQPESILSPLHFWAMSLSCLKDGG